MTITGVNTGTRGTIAGLEAEARVRLDPDHYDYYAAGSGREVSLSEAEAGWLAYRFRPRALADVPGVAGIDTTVPLLGRTLAAPIAVAPMAFQQMLDGDGEVAMVTGAADTLVVVSARADKPLDEVGAAARNWWYQVYVSADRSIGEGRAEAAAAAGAAALVLTADTPVVATKTRGSARDVALDAQQVAATTAALPRLQDLTGLPVLVKGVLRGDDAQRALDAGAAGIVVSNHGGRQLDRAVPTARVLAEVVAAAGPAPVLVDGGLRGGHDVLAALALGATAVLAGRPFAWALAAGGAKGVRRLLDEWTAEFAEVLALAGCGSCADVGPDLVVPR